MQTEPAISPTSGPNQTKGSSPNEKTEATEVRSKRRRFSSEAKNAFLALLDEASASDRGIIMRQEWVYGSVMHNRRKQLQQLGSLDTQKRGRKPALASQRAAEMAQLK